MTEAQGFITMQVFHEESLVVQHHCLGCDEHPDGKHLDRERVIREDEESDDDFLARGQDALARAWENAPNGRYRLIRRVVSQLFQEEIVE